MNYLEILKRSTRVLTMGKRWYFNKPSSNAGLYSLKDMMPIPEIKAKAKEKFERLNEQAQHLFKNFDLEDDIDRILAIQWYQGLSQRERTELKSSICHHIGYNACNLFRREDNNMKNQRIKIKKQIAKAEAEAEAEAEANPPSGSDNLYECPGVLNENNSTDLTTLQLPLPQKNNKVMKKPRSTKMLNSTYTRPPGIELDIPDEYYYNAEHPHFGKSAV